MFCFQIMWQIYNTYFFKKFQNKNKVDIWFDPHAGNREILQQKSNSPIKTPPAHFLLQAEIQKYMIHNDTINEFE